jgi:phosphatidylserine/phosphatidylglycerophosphate/cardiolipin synthase-like enzyme
MRSTPFQWQADNGKDEFFVGTYRDSGSPIRDSLIELLRAAKTNVFIASFILGDQLVIDEIVAAADRLTGGVYVITALDERSLRRGLEEYDLDESTESPEERRKNFKRLTSRGIYVRGHESCHAKFAIADNSLALVGSANFVKNGFVWTGEANVVIRSASEVGRLKRLFTQLWYEGCTYEIPPGVTYKVAQRAPTASPAQLPAEQTSSGSIVWTNDSGSTSLLECIKEVINSARTSLILSSYSIVGMESNPDLLFNDIISAARRGVNVSLFVRQRNAWPSQCEDLNSLHEEGVGIFADVRNHAKVAIADGREAVLFSANFDAAHGLNSGVEVGYRLSDPAEIRQLVAYLDHAIEYADTQFLNNPLLCELDGRLAAKWCSAWRLNSEVEISGIGLELGYLDNSDTIPPAIYEEAKNGAIHIWVGNHEVVGKDVGGRFRGSLASNPSAIHSADKLKSWLQSVRRPKDPDIVYRGFFAGSILAV